MPRSPEIFDPYIGKVYGNILDQYDNATYNIKLAVIPAEAIDSPSANSEPSTSSSTNSGSAARETTTGPAMPGTDVMTGYLQPESNQPISLLKPAATAPAATAPAPITGKPLTYVPGTKLPTAGTGTFSENIQSLNSYLVSRGLRTAENRLIGDEFSNVHKGAGHNYYDSAIDVNLGTGNPAGERDALNAVAGDLTRAGYNVIWQTEGHFNHLHVEIPSKYQDTQAGWKKGGPSSGNGGSSSGNSSDNGTRLNTVPPIPPDRQVIIAQTGVTAVTIDNLEITHTPNTQGNFYETKLSFTLTQPGAANLLDQIQLARAYLDGDNTGDYYFLLEISFVGYNSSPEDNAAGGEPVLIAGPFAWRIKSSTVEAQVTASGSVYNFGAVPTGVIDGSGSTVSYNDTVFRVPAQLSTYGDTITKHVASLQTALNEYQKRNATAWSAPDEYKFDLSGLLASGGGTGSDNRIRDEQVATNNSPDTEKTGVASNNQTPLVDSEDAQNLNEATKKTSGTRSEQLPDGGKLDISEQTTLMDYFAKLLNMNKEFRGKISNLENIDDPTSKVDPAKLFTSWFTVEINTQLRSYDPKRGDYTKTYIVRPIIYKTSRPDIQRLSVAESTTNEDLATSELAATALLEQLIAENQLFKSYKYFFTGENDQIIDLNIRYNSAHTLITPPRGGFVGDTSVANAVALNPTLPATAPADIFNSIKSTIDRVKNAQTLVNFFKTLAPAGRETIAQTLGQTDEQIKAILADTSGKTAEAYAAQLDAVTLARTANALKTASGDSATTPTSGIVGTNPDGSTYTPETSGRIYAEDLVNATFAGALTFDQIREAGLISVMNKTPDEVFAMQQKVNSVNTLATQAEASTYSDGGIGNTLFSYIHQQHNTVNFLQTVDLTLRGDPWYLGRATTHSNPDQSKISAYSLNYMLLTIASPLPFDFNTADEDANSGYWNMNGMSQSFSGLYSLMSATNKFSDGNFTTEVRATKTTIPLLKIRPLKPGEAPENYVRNGVDISADPDKYIMGIPKNAPGATGGTGGPVTGTAPAGKPLDPALEDSYWKALEAKEAANRKAARLPATFSEAERRAINGILASEGGDPGSNLATMLNRSYQSSDALNRGVPINEIVFATNQFTPAAAASIGVNDVVAGADLPGAQRFVGGYTSAGTTNLSAAIGSYEKPLTQGVNYFRSDQQTPNAQLYATINGQYYSAGQPGNFATNGAKNEQLFYS